MRFNLAVEAACQQVLRAVRPSPIVRPEREPDLQHALGEALLSPYQDNWDSPLTARQVDALWEFWTWVAEESLLVLSHVALTEAGQVDQASPLPQAPLGFQRGRGPRRLMKHINLCPRQRRMTDVPETAPLARLPAALGVPRRDRGR